MMRLLLGGGERGGGGRGGGRRGLELVTKEVVRMLEKGVRENIGNVNKGIPYLVVSGVVVGLVVGKR